MSDLQNSWRIRLSETKIFCRICFLPNQLTELTQIETTKMTKFITREVVEICLLEQTRSVKNCYLGQSHGCKHKHISWKTLEDLSVAIQAQVKKYWSVTFLSLLQLRAVKFFFLYLNSFTWFYQKQFFIQERLTFGYKYDLSHLSQPSGFKKLSAITAHFSGKLKFRVK